MNIKLRNTLLALVPVIAMASGCCTPSECDSQNYTDGGFIGSDGCIIDVQPDRGDPPPAVKGVQATFDQPGGKIMGRDSTALSFVAPFDGAFAIGPDRRNNSGSSVFLAASTVREKDKYVVQLAPGPKPTDKCRLVITRYPCGGTNSCEIYNEDYVGYKAPDVQGLKANRVSLTTYEGNDSNGAYVHLITSIYGGVAMDIVIRTPVGSK